MDPRAHFTMLPRYNAWATHKLYEHVDALSEDDYRRECVCSSQRWQPLIEARPLDRFDGRLDYTSMNGVPRRLPFAAALAHVFNHGTHHRRLCAMCSPFSISAHRGG